MTLISYLWHWEACSMWFLFFLQSKNTHIGKPCRPNERRVLAILNFEWSRGANYLALASCRLKTTCQVIDLAVSQVKFTSTRELKEIWGKIFELHFRIEGKSRHYLFFSLPIGAFDASKDFVTAFDDANGPWADLKSLLSCATFASNSDRAAVLILA